MKKIVVNPNTSNLIQMWIWYPDFKALSKFIDERIKIISEWDD